MIVVTHSETLGARFTRRWRMQRGVLTSVLPTRMLGSMLRAACATYTATNAMVVLGVAVAVAVLAGALLVGASVRESLRQIALGRLGATDVVVTAPTSFRAALADDCSTSRPAAPAASVIVAGGAVSHDESQTLRRPRDGLRHRRALRPLPRRRRPHARPAAKRSSVRRSRPSSARRPATASRCASQAPPTFRCRRCKAAAKSTGRTHSPDHRARPRSRRRSASSPSRRRKARCSRSTCRWRACSATSTSAIARIRCW